MPKLNAALMAILAVALIATAGFLVLHHSSPREEEPARAQRLIRKLADSDDDLRREGEDGLRRMGPAALGPLKEASTSADRVLAGRAAKLLQEFQPTAPAERPSPSAE
ncbi:MAG TPA: hypothetical protein VG457_02965 [Planctomycetota bacterium]|jgi:hypothetical protein|nr:hypothetical protein [Planctomycetota bacterium]